MGKDGADGLLAMRKAGCATLGQNESTALVYGMPRVAFEIGRGAAISVARAAGGDPVRVRISQAVFSCCSESPMTQPDPNANFDLPATLDPNAARLLVDELGRLSRESEICLNAAAVSAVSPGYLQILVSAFKTFPNIGVSNPSRNSPRHSPRTELISRPRQRCQRPILQRGGIGGRARPAAPPGKPPPAH